MKYESDILKRLINTYGVVGNPRYISEIIKEFIVRGKERFPELFTYQSDWLTHIDEFGLNPTYTVSYTGQSFYAPNTLERPVKSAILYGNTLLNNVDLSKATLSNNNEITEDGYIIAYANGAWSNAFIGQRQMEANTKYLCAVFVYENTLNSGSFSYLSDWQDSAVFKLDANGNYGFNTGEIGTKIFTMTTKHNINDGQYSFRAFLGVESTSGYVKFRVVAIKYEDYMENWNIDYFKDFGGSVKMPVLTTLNTTNLYCFSDLSDEKEVVGGHNMTISKFISVEPGETIYFNQNVSAYAYVRFYSEDGIQISQIQVAGHSGELGFYGKSYHVVPENAQFMKILVRENQIDKMMVNRGNDYLPYEKGKPYKSNILTVNEDVTLRSNGDICDELNLLSGQLTQRIGEDGVVLSQEVVKTVDLTILDQNGQSVKQLMSFNGGTHFNTKSLEGTPLPMASVSVETDLEETLKVCSLEGNTM